MARINLRDIYPHYKGDCFVEIPDNILKVMEDCERKEEAYRRYLRYHKVTLVLDADNTRNIEADIVDKPLMPHDIIDHKITSLLLHQAIAQLSGKQAKRIYAHFYLGMSKTEIAIAEGVNERAVRDSIKCGLQNLKKNLKRFF